jgi:glutaredoxin-related protein
MASRFYYGLNTSNYLTDIVDADDSLRNMGINIEDIDIIRGISEEGVSKFDIRTISNLNSDVKKELISLQYATDEYIRLLDNFEISTIPQPSNIEANTRIGATAIKYKYIDFDNVEIKSSDISIKKVF